MEILLFLDKGKKVKSLDLIAIFISLTSEIKRYLKLIIDWFTIIVIITTLSISILGLPLFSSILLVFFCCILISRLIYIKRFRFQIEPEHLRVQRGILKTKFTVIHKKKVHDIVITQSAIEKIFKRNTITLSTSGSRDDEFTVSGVDNQTLYELENIFPKSEFQWEELGKIRKRDYFPLLFNLSRKSISFSFSMIILIVTVLINGFDYDLKNYFDKSFQAQIDEKEIQRIEEINRDLIQKNFIIYDEMCELKNKAICNNLINEKFIKNIKRYDDLAMTIPYEEFDKFRNIVGKKSITNLIKYDILLYNKEKSIFFIEKRKRVKLESFYGMPKESIVYESEKENVLFISNVIFRGLFFYDDLSLKAKENADKRLDFYKTIIKKYYNDEQYNNYEFLNYITQINIWVYVYDNYGNSNNNKVVKKVAPKVNVSNLIKSENNENILKFKKEIEASSENQYKEFLFFSNLINNFTYMFKSNVVDYLFYYFLVLLFFINAFYNILINLNTKYYYKNNCILIRRVFLSTTNDKVDLDRISNISVKKIKFGTVTNLQLKYINSSIKSVYFPVHIVDKIISKKYIKGFDLKNKIKELNSYNYVYKKHNILIRFAELVLLHKVQHLSFAMIMYLSFGYNHAILLFLMITNFDLLYFSINYKKIPHLLSYNFSNNSLERVKLGIIWDNYAHMPYDSIINTEININLMHRIFKLALLKIECNNGSGLDIVVKNKDAQRIESIIKKGMLKNETTNS
jgi:uncharacterized membrane protein YdbT with pleckstrin-like domain